MEVKDEQLVKDFLSGDEAAFELLVKKYLKPIFNFLFQMTRDKSVAEDLTQITFVKAWKNIHKFASRSNYFATLHNNQKKSLAPYRTAGSGSGFKTWLYTIAKNSAYDYFKKKKTIPFSNFVDEDGNNKLENISDGEVFPEEILMKKDAEKEMAEKLKKIPEHYQLILNMRYKDDFSFAEIAEILGRPYNTVKSQHNRALASLKKVFLNN
jgi:RNA polymerase sigma-70 factor (ECF subfamily)